MPAHTEAETLRMPTFGLVIVGDEILSGKRVDKHMPAVIERLGARGLQLGWAEYAGDNRQRLTAVLERAFASGDVVFSCGGIGATPDDHTRQCAAAALGLPLVLHAGAKALILERMQDTAREQGVAFEPERPDNLHRLNMGVFPQGAELIPNPYNKIPGFSCRRDPAAGWEQGSVHFVPGFPVMAWPMIDWVLEQHFAPLFHRTAWKELSVVVFGSMEATLTPLMESLEQRFAGIRVFSLPSVDHPVHGRHIELGVKGADTAELAQAYAALCEGLRAFKVEFGPEMVRSS